MIKSPVLWMKRPNLRLQGADEVIHKPTRLYYIYPPSGDYNITRVRFVSLLGGIKYGDR